MGDNYGILNTLFSGFAFLGLLLTISLQMRELKLQRQELEKTVEANESIALMSLLNIEKQEHQDLLRIRPRWSVNYDVNNSEVLFTLKLEKNTSMILEVLFGEEKPINTVGTELYETFSVDSKTEFRFKIKGKIDRNKDFKITYQDIDHNMYEQTFGIPIETVISHIPKLIAKSERSEMERSISEKTKNLLSKWR
ncbi:hypothetical protein [Reichenbachiella sp. MSK19-1]|uniref:hypothetical protein n=1 Tax=Reichenbachiella sp. MSK19-1 TaxID=1897631 RepID=UPI0011C4816D|nr:hypothetical protein [Reichenbachiella sp. MSK19-1]